jgi:hypothetical protein
MGSVLWVAVSGDRGSPRLTARLGTRRARPSGRWLPRFVVQFELPTLVALTAGVLPGLFTVGCSSRLTE